MRRNPFRSAYQWITQVDSDDPNIVRRARLLNVVIAGVLALMALLIPTLVFGTNMAVTAWISLTCPCTCSLACWAR